MNKPKVLISILNWNKAEQTLACVASLMADINPAIADVTVLVIDNGSKAEEVVLLHEASAKSGFALHAVPKNLGFTGGHNVAIQMAIDEQYDFIWLMNNDATVNAGVLSKLIKAMHSNPRCGAVSPVIHDLDGGETVTACVGTHDWKKRNCQRIVSIPEARRIQIEHPEAVWLVGTAIFFRIEALKQVGPLDNDLFAYWDDNDIGARLAAAGWLSECVFDVSVCHETRTIADHPPYVYYLFQRNEMLFWHKNTPAAYRRLLWLKVLDTALFDVNRLYRLGLMTQGDAALLGVYDFLRGRFGAPELNRKSPFMLRLICKISAWINEKKVIVPTVDVPNRA